MLKCEYYMHDQSFNSLRIVNFHAQSNYFMQKMLAISLLANK